MNGENYFKKANDSLKSNSKWGLTIWRSQSVIELLSVEIEEFYHLEDVTDDEMREKRIT